MKKLITLITLGSLLFGGASFAQTEGDGASGERDRNQFRLPHVIRDTDNKDVTDALTAYQDAKGAFRLAMSALRTNADGVDKEGLRTARRLAMSTFKEAQHDFRRLVREEIRTLRSAASGE
jgi:hypothetical protein